MKQTKTIIKVLSQLLTQLTHDTLDDKWIYHHVDWFKIMIETYKDNRRLVKQILSDLVDYHKSEGMHSIITNPNPNHNWVKVINAYNYLTK